MTSAGNKTVLLLNEVDGYLRDLAEIGCNGFDCDSEGLEKMKKWDRPPIISTETLEAIQAELGNCRRCRLCGGRNQIVFGAGNPRAKLVFVGEGPGAAEDRSGEPFMGAAGELLTNIIKAIKLTREEVYLCNVVKCRPPENRKPSEEEIRICLPFLKRQLRAIAPEYICALGSVATRALLHTSQSVSMLRGQILSYESTLVMPTFHPDVLLKNPEKKREVWEDMKKLARTMGLILN